MNYQVAITIPKGQWDTAVSRIRDVRVLIKRAGGATKLVAKGLRLELSIDADPEPAIQAVDMARRIEVDAARADHASDRKLWEYAKQNAKKSDPYDDLLSRPGKGGPFGGGF